MISSRARSRRPRSIAATPVATLLVLIGSGCAHMGGAPAPPQTARSEPARAPEADRAAAPSEPRRAPAAAPARPSSEEITPGELASIPDPLGGAAPAAAAAPPSAPSKAPAEPPSDRSAPAGAAAPASSGSWLWRVQVLATPDRALADSVAAQAAERLGSTAEVVYDAPLYKVRLGAFASERDAQGLRDRAVEMGYPGAFRVKNPRAATDE